MRLLSTKPSWDERLFQISYVLILRVHAKERGKCIPCNQYQDPKNILFIGSFTPLTNKNVLIGSFFFHTYFLFIEF